MFTLKIYAKKRKFQDSYSVDLSKYKIHFKADPAEPGCTAFANSVDPDQLA